MNYSIHGIKKTPSVLEDVIILYKKHSSRLGPFPRGAFDEYTEKNEILVAISTKNKSLLGYLLYRRVRKNHSIAIAQVCVCDDAIGNNISDSLIEKLKSICIAEGCIAITLNCREDYTHAKKLWVRSGFCPLTEHEGKNKKGYKLLHWVWENNKANDLFGYETNFDQNKHIVVIDINIAIKYRDKDDELVSYLMGDWLNDEVEIFYTPELLIESARNTDKTIRAETREAIMGLNKIPYDEDKFLSAYKYINEKLPPCKTKQDKSDRKQLAYSCAFNADFFVSTDNKLVDDAQCITDKYDVLIYRPEEFILHFDKHLNSDAYNPSRLKGSFNTISKIHPNDAHILKELFLQRSKSELSISFKSSLNGLISSIDECTCLKVTIESSIKALIGYKFEKNIISVQLLRIIRDGDFTTLSMQLVEDLIKDSIKKNADSIYIEDKYFNISHDILMQAGFIELDKKWVRPLITGVTSYQELLSSSSNDISNDECTFHKYLNNTNYNKNKLEKALWPIKFSDNFLPVYVIPIHMTWAMNLFDYQIAGNDLFGSIPSLAFNYENVYYSATRQNLQFPARILWYIKKDNKNLNTGHIRATSYMDKAIKNTPNVLFRDFKRLGVFKWDDVYSLANRNIQNKLTAILFSKTELLDKPVSFEAFQSIQKNQIQSPFTISHEKYLEIYTDKL